MQRLAPGVGERLPFGDVWSPHRVLCGGKLPAIGWFARFSSPFAVAQDDTVYVRYRISPVSGLVE